MVDNLAHVDARLALRVAQQLGIGVPDAKAAAGRAGFRAYRIEMPLQASPALSMQSAPPGGIHTRKVAVLVAAGVKTGALRAIQQALHDAGAVCRIVSTHLGVVPTASGQQLAVDHTFANMPSVMFDAVLVPGGLASAQALASIGDAVHFVLEAYKHCKPICVIGEGAQLLRTLGIGADGQALPDGMVVGKGDAASRVQMAQDFIAAMARHRHWGRVNVEAVPA